MIGIIGAMDEETDGLTAKMSDRSEVVIKSFRFVKGKLKGKELVVCTSGIGKVSSASAAVLMLSTFKDIDLVINLGVAGGIMPNIKQGDIVIASASVQHDYYGGGEQRGSISRLDIIEFRSDVDAVKQMERVLSEAGYTFYTGVIATGDCFVNDKSKAIELNTIFNAFACDMESAAIAHACHLMNTKFLSMRAISDNGDGTALEDFYSFVLKAAMRSIDAIERFIVA